VLELELVAAAFLCRRLCLQLCTALHWLTPLQLVIPLQLATALQLPGKLAGVAAPDCWLAQPAKARNATPTAALNTTPALDTLLIIIFPLLLLIHPQRTSKQARENSINFELSSKKFMQ